MKRILSTLMMFILVVPILHPIRVHAADSMDYGLYKSVFEKINEENIWDYQSYALFDMDSDGVEELVLKIGSGEAGFKYKFYTIIQGQVAEIGEFMGAHSTLFANEDGEGIIHAHGFQGSERVTLITLDDSSSKKSIKTSTMYSRNLGEDDEYFYNSYPIEHRITTDLVSKISQASTLTDAQKALGFRMIKVTQKETKSYPVIVKDGEIFFSGKDLARITGFGYYLSDTNAKFQRGEKEIIIDLKKNILYPMKNTSLVDSINLPQELCCIDGEYYFPASQLLPWLNVSCGEKNGILHIYADEVSLWDIWGVFNPDQFYFDFVDCCHELGVNNKYLKAKSYIVDNGLMFIYDLIPIGLECTYGKYMDYYDIFDDMFKDKNSIEYSLYELTEDADTISSAFDLIEDINESLGEDDDNLPDEVALIKELADALSLLSFAADGAVYYTSFRQDNKEKLAMMDAITSSRNYYEYPEPLSSAAIAIANSYRSLYEGFEFRIMRAIEEGLFGKLTSGDGIINKIFDVIGLLPKENRDLAENIERVSKYETIASYERKAYFGEKYFTFISSIRAARCHARLYLYSSEQNWRTMAEYAQKINKKELANKYLEKAESTLPWQGKFLAASYAEQNDSHEYGDGRLKTNYTKELFSMFSRLEYSN